MTHIGAFIYTSHSRRGMWITRSWLLSWLTLALVFVLCAVWFSCCTQPDAPQAQATPDTALIQAHDAATSVPVVMPTATVTPMRGPAEAQTIIDAVKRRDAERFQAAKAVGPERIDK